jgi:hypothetical protein
LVAATMTCSNVGVRHGVQRVQVLRLHVLVDQVRPRLDGARADLAGAPEHQLPDERLDLHQLARLVVASDVQLTQGVLQGLLVATLQAGEAAEHLGDRQAARLVLRGRDDLHVDRGLRVLHAGDVRLRDDLERRVVRGVRQVVRHGEPERELLVRAGGDLARGGDDLLGQLAQIDLRERLARLRLDVHVDETHRELAQGKRLLTAAEVDASRDDAARRGRGRVEREGEGGAAAEHRVEKSHGVAYGP